MKKILVLMFILVCFAGTASALPILNGNFENGLTDWGISSTGTMAAGSGITTVADPNPLNVGNNVAQFNLLNASTAVPIVPAVLNLFQNFTLDPLVQTIRIEFDFMFSNAVATAGDFFRDVIRIDTVGGTTSRFDTVAGRTVFRDPLSMMGTYGVDISLAGLNLAATDPNARLVFSLRSMDMLATSALLDNVSITVVPEPSTLILLGCGLLGLAVFSKRRKYLI